MLINEFVPLPRKDKSDDVKYDIQTKHERVPINNATALKVLSCNMRMVGY